MKKYVIGFIIGALVMASGQVAADTISKVGKKIQGEAIVKIDGETASSAIIVDAKSYAPVRDIAEALGATASYSKGVITIETTMTDEMINEKLTNLKGQKAFLEQEIETTTAALDRINTTFLPKAEERYKNSQVQSSRDDAAAEIEIHKANIVKYTAALAEYKAQLTEINNQIAELESAQ